MLGELAVDLSVDLGTSLIGMDRSLHMISHCGQREGDNRQCDK